MQETIGREKEAEEDGLLDEKKKINKGLYVMEASSTASNACFYRRHKKEEKEKEEIE